MTGVYFDNYKRRWIAKIQRNNKVIKKGFISYDDAVNYRKELKKMNMNDGLDNFNFVKTLKFYLDGYFDDNKNCVRQEEQKTVVYQGYKQEFCTTNDSTGETLYGYYFVPATKAKIIHKDTATIVIFEDGSKGVAKCGKDDTYSRKTGLKIAYNRAMIQHLQKEIDKLGGNNGRN
jgi:hypothetical protein